MVKLGRKAMMDDWFDYIFTIVAMIFIFLFAGSIFSGQLQQEQESMAEQVDTWLGDDNVVSLMSMPIERDNLEMSYSEFITYSQNIQSSDKSDLFQEPTSQVLDSIHGSYNWGIYTCLEVSQGYNHYCWLSANFDQFMYASEQDTINYGQIYFHDMENKEINLMYRTLK